MGLSYNTGMEITLDLQVIDDMAGVMAAPLPIDLEVRREGSIGGAPDALNVFLSSLLCL